MDRNIRSRFDFLHGATVEHSPSRAAKDDFQQPEIIRNVSNIMRQSHSFKHLANDRPRILILTAIGTSLLSSGCAFAEQRALSGPPWSSFHEVAATVPAPAVPLTGPGANDVTMRTLEFRDVPPGSPMDALGAVKDFHATRLEWTYVSFDDRNRKLIDQIKEWNVVFGGAGASSQHSSLTGFPKQPEEIGMIDLAGNPVRQPHVRAWADFRGIGDPSNPDYYAHHLAYYKKVIDWGAQTLQRDEPEGAVFAAQRYGGGFSETGLAGFSEWLAENLSPGQLDELGIGDPAAFDYGDYLRGIGAPAGDDFARFADPIKPYWVRYWEEINTTFFERLLRDVKAYAEEPITFSANNSSLQMWEPYHLVFDFAISELLLETANPVHIWERSLRARENGKVQVLGPPKTRAQPVSEKEKIMLLRKVAATAYACGMIGKVPWDVFDQSPDGESRYFAKPSTIADLFAFVRGGDWNGYEEVAAFGPGIASNSPLSETISVSGGNGGVFGFVRVAREVDRPILIHLIDWGLPSETPGPGNYFTSPSGERIRMYTAKENIQRAPAEAFVLRINSTNFTNLDHLSFHLLAPAAYDRATHRKAAETRDYDALTKRTPLEVQREGDKLVLDLPALSPWGIVEITADNRSP